MALDERYCKYVSSRGIAKFCNVYPNQFKSDTYNFDENDYKNIKNKDIVYVITTVLNKFTKKILPELEEKNIKIKLVVGASILGIPDEVSQKHSINYLDRLFENDSIIHLYCQNYDLDYKHDRISLIPLGLDYHTLQETNSSWGNKISAIEQDHTIQRIALLKPFNQRLNKSFSCFQFQKFKRHGADRYIAYEELKNKEFNEFLSQKTNRNKLWEIFTDYKFIISPHGNGLDCHRTYEAICLGCIPVVKSSSLDILYKDMPIIIIPNWENLNIQDLIKKAEIIKKKKYNDTISLLYWEKFINS